MSIRRLRTFIKVAEEASSHIEETVKKLSILAYETKDKDRKIYMFLLDAIIQGHYILKEIIPIEEDDSENEQI